MTLGQHCPCPPACPAGKSKAGASRKGSRGQEGGDRPERDKVTKDPLPRVLPLGLGPVLPAGSESFPRHPGGASGGNGTSQAQGGGAGGGHAGLHCHPARAAFAQEASPQPRSGVGGGLGPQGQVVPFQRRARHGSEEGAACACPTSSSPQRGPKHRRVRLLRTPPGRSPPTAWLLRCC